jgi:hypothetical protein
VVVLKSDGPRTIVVVGVAGSVVEIAIEHPCMGTVVPVAPNMRQTAFQESTLNSDFSQPPSNLPTSSNFSEATR